MTNKLPASILKNIKQTCSADCISSPPTSNHIPIATIVYINAHSPLQLPTQTLAASAFGVSPNETSGYVANLTTHPAVVANTSILPNQCQNGDFEVLQYWHYLRQN
uniref:Uncharacterized protein n=1 Tax=Glossina pallidipes TaxID=7398 RepID=A0A1B0A771_GLOPL